ncbi:hypothetical protein SEEE2558_01523 [Salmonella enterica subsp. enterica serovar Enteritidis str. 22558]|nr:hypothetical protein SEEE2558_01523 [Salmonella enterica subsp. enterica serovar Enteritidis str. 22558]
MNRQIKFFQISKHLLTHIKCDPVSRKGVKHCLQSFNFCFFTHAIIKKRGESIIAIDAFDEITLCSGFRATTI